MRLIDTSGISSTVGYPGLANVGGQSVGNSPLHLPGDPSKFQGLDFLQQALLDMVDALCRALVVDLSVPTVIAFIPFSDGGGLEAGVAEASYVYYKGELFFVPSYTLFLEIGGGGGGSGGNYVANINYNPTDNGITAPVTTFSDSSTGSIHNQRTITVSWDSAGGTGDFPNPSTWETPFTNFLTFAPTIKVVGAAGQPAFNSSWAASPRLMFYSIGNEVTIQGGVSWGPSASSLIFTLPDGYRPAQDLFFNVPGTTDYIGLSSSGGTVSYGGSTSGGGAINFTAKFTIL